MLVSPLKIYRVRGFPSLISSIVNINVPRAAKFVHAAIVYVTEVIAPKRTSFTRTAIMEEW
jgi:hypothetical protein